LDVLLDRHNAFCLRDTLPLGIKYPSDALTARLRALGLLARSPGGILWARAEKSPNTGYQLFVDELLE
jgi:hypothetical protein